MSNDLIEQAADVAAAPLVTMEPEKYVAAIFATFMEKLEAYKVRAASATYDITTTAGMKLATELRAEGKAIRVASEKVRKERKAPILEIGKLLDSRQKDIEAVIDPLESKFDSDIKAEEARKEAIRMEKINAEIARTTAIRERIAKIQRWPADAAGQSALMIYDEMTHLEQFQIDESFAEFAAEATEAKAEALAKLQSMHAAALEKEVAEAAAEKERQAVAQRQREEDARLQREREELAALRAQDEQRRAAEAAQAAAERAAADKDLEEKRQELARQEEALAEKQRAAQVEEQKLRDAELASQREKERQAAEEEQARIAAQRKADDAAHKASVHSEIFHALVAHDFSEEHAAKLMDLLSVDAIPHLSITY